MRHVSLVLAARLHLLARSVLILMCDIILLRFGLSRECHVNLVVALRSTLFVLYIVVHVNLDLALSEMRISLCFSLINFEILCI